MILIKLNGLKEALNSFDPVVVRQAARSAIDRAVESGKSAASEEIRKVWNVQKSDLDNRIKISPPRIDDLTAVLSIYGKGMSLSYFGARQITGGTVRSRLGQQIRSEKLSRKLLAFVPMPKGVIVEVIKGRPATLIRNAFLAKVSAGKSGSHIGVYHRLTKNRLPIEEKKVISVATMANRPEVMQAIVTRISDRWMKEFPHQLQYFMSKAVR